jgi:hypothetical protein
MPQPNLKYADEKFTAVVQSLATGTDPLKRRLGYAFMTLVRVQQDDFPDKEMKSKFDDIIDRLTKEGPVEATVTQMNDDEARALANSIVDLFLAIRQELYVVREM